MRRTCVAFIASALLGAARLAAAPCAPADTALCLSASRFRVEVSWKDFQGRTGAGHAVALTPDTGYFWFFNAANVELVVKVLDARAVNGKFWVFFGALSNVEYTLTVRDTVTGSTKSYRNPAGRFASVGDTAAFAGAAAAATHETMAADGTDAAPSSYELIQRLVDSAPAATAFTPCPDTRFGMLLNGCRFHIEVKWDAGGGRTGRGHWVQLTNDTGYFWFFNPANVELIVKVLDARVVSGKFWVFFGALSNVRYTIAVTDTVTGSYKSYVNRAGKLASVGDTAAFQGGYSVASVKDSGRAAAAELDARGGAVTATGADGTVFTLEIPPDALLGPETVTLTPISRLDRLPFSGGLAAGVEIEPVGLALMVPATLRIQTASAPPVNRTLPYSYRRGGEDFILYPRDPDTSSLRLPLVEFGGYGVGLGDLSEAASQVKRSPAAPLATYLQRSAYEVLLRARGQITQQELVARAARIFREEWDRVVAPRLQPPAQSPVELLSHDNERIVSAAVPPDWRCGDDFRESMAVMLGMIRQCELFKFSFCSDVAENGFEEALEFLRECQQQAYDRCVQLNDPFEIVRMVEIARQLQMLGEEDLRLTSFIEDGLLERCVRFEVDFESKVVVDAIDSEGAGFVLRLKYRAQHVPLRFNYAGNDYSNRSIWEGECTLIPELATFESDNECAIAVHTGNGWFQAHAAWIAVDRNPAKSAVRLLYYPGDPQATATASCSQEVPFGLANFANHYGFLHNDETTFYNLFMAKDWDQLRFDSGPSQNGEFFAKKSYERTIPLGGESTITEETWFFLKHTPDAPMPDCP